MNVAQPVREMAEWGDVAWLRLGEAGQWSVNTMAEARRARDYAHKTARKHGVAVHVWIGPDRAVIVKRIG